MSFLYPTFLFGLFAIIIPIIIHLFHFRSFKTIYFSNILFLKNVKQETKSKSNLKHILVLISRILAVSSLVLAFSQPYIPYKNQTENISDQIAVYIDNSFSTEAESKYGKISESAKSKAFQIIDAYPEQSKFIFLTNDFDQKHQHFVSKEQIKDFISEIKLSPKVTPLSEVIERILYINGEENNTSSKIKIYLISDFQKCISDIENFKTDSIADIVLVPLESENTDNIFIDSVWFDSPYRPMGQQDKIFVKISNRSENFYQELPIKLYLNDTLKSAEFFNIDASETIVKQINFTNHSSGIINGRIEITDFPVSFDNIFYFNFDITKTHNILILSNKTHNKFLENVFAEQKNVIIKYSDFQSSLSENFKKYNSLIIDNISSFSDKTIQDLYSYVNEGGTLIIFPGIDINMQSYNTLFNKLGTNYITEFDTLKIYAEKINYKAEILKNVFKAQEKNPELPYFNKYLKFSNQTDKNEETILFSEKNDKLIFASSVGSGLVYIFAQSADAASGNLVYHPIWASLLYNMVFFHNNFEPAYYTIGNEEAIQYTIQDINSDKPVHIVNTDNTIDIIPLISTIEGYHKRLFLNNLITNAGHYLIKNGNETIKGFSLNYNRTESNLEKYTSDEINSEIEKKSLTNFSIIKQSKTLLNEDILKENRGNPLWKLFIISALFFLLLEIIFIRYVFNKKKL
jgi:hypothetical protein